MENGLMLEMLYLDCHIDENYRKKNLCLIWDLNLRSPVLRTGVLAIRLLIYIQGVKK